MGVEPFTVAAQRARLVLLAIADSMNTAHSWAWPSTKEIARKANLTGRAVQLAVADLAKLGELEVGYNEGPRGCNRFRVPATTPEKFSPPNKVFTPKNLHPRRIFGGPSLRRLTARPPKTFHPPKIFHPRKVRH